MKKKLIIFALCFVCYVGHTQKATLANADEKYERYAYIDAIKLYERVAEKGYKSADMFKKLGDAYYFNSEHVQAAKWYGQLFAMKNVNIAPEYYYRYAISLKSVGQYQKSDEMMTLFAKKSSDDSRAAIFKDSGDYLAEIQANSGRYVIEDAGINSALSDYGSTVYNSKLIFTSSRDTGSIISRKHKWTNQSFTTLYAAEVVADTVRNPEKFEKNLNSRFHESTPVFTKDGLTMYFTRNNFNNGTKGKNKQQITLLKIYRAKFRDGKWQEVTELPFNNDNYSVAHPALSPDGKYLYFASDMPGTRGQSDLFRVAIHSDGSFGKPENLGPEINTEGRETFPFVSDDNELYFTTDGRPGLGGLDIYVTQISARGFSNPQNIGEPANSPKDDFAFYIDTKNQKGFLSSNRDGGKGYDDIYKFTELRKLACDQNLIGVVTDADSGEFIPNAIVTQFDSEFVKIAETNADSAGKYSFNAKCSENYYIRATKPLYSVSELKVVIPPTSGTTELNLALQKNIKQIAPGSDLAKLLDIKMIYFDLDKWEIREDAAAELSKILEVLKQYPTMKIDIRSHTDSRQSHKYNQVLSGKRASSTIDWFVANGIDSTRLTGKGYGETQLLNKCTDGVTCTEAEHQLNRRSEFIVIQL